MNSKLDLLETAHLAYVRGGKQEAREQLDLLLSMQPDNVEAIKLREEIERDVVEDITVENDRRDQEIAVELNGYQLVACAIASALALLAGIWNAVTVVLKGLRIGFNTEELAVYQGVTSAHYPVHVALIEPLVFIVLGGIGLRIVYLNLRVLSRNA